MPLFRRNKRNERRCRREPEDVRKARVEAEQAAERRDRAKSNEARARRIGSMLRDALEGDAFGEALESALTPRKGTTR